MIRVLWAIFILAAVPACQTAFVPPSPRPQTPGVPVNVFLWRGALDTLSFLPLAHTDPFGGVIISEWYTPNTTERFKITATILSQTLRSDGVKVNVIRETRQDGVWVSTTSQTVADTLTDLILTRAREQRIAAREAQ